MLGGKQIEDWLDMKAAEALIAWTPSRMVDNPTAGQVKIGPLFQRELHNDWSAPYAKSGGAANVFWREIEGWEAVAFVFIEFNTLVARDGIPPEVAHEAFLNIDEYAERISPEMSGARKRDNSDA